MSKTIPVGGMATTIRNLKSLQAIRHKARSRKPRYMATLVSEYKDSEGQTYQRLSNGQVIKVRGKF